MKKMASRQARIAFTIKRIKGFMSALQRSKRGLVGIAILVIAIFVAVAAPLITPYNSVSTFNLAADWAQPSWARYLPSGAGLSENMHPVNEFAQLLKPDALKGFNITVEGSAQAISNFAMVAANGAFLVTISPISVTMNFSQSRTFLSNVSGVPGPYTFQWYLNGTAVSKAISPTWLFTPAAVGTYYVFLNVQYAGGQTTSNMATVVVNGKFFVSISPSSATLNFGQSQTFTSVLSGATTPIIYQWYANGVAVPGVTSANWTFTPSWPLGTFSYKVYLTVTSGTGFKQAIVPSNVATITLLGLVSTSITPTSAAVNFGQSQTFTSNAYGGVGALTYQWYANGVAVPGANSAAWTFVPSSSGSYFVYLKVTDTEDIQAQNDVAVQHSAFGITSGGSGSLAVICQTADLPMNASITITISTDFNYPYSGVPGTMNASGAILPSRISGVSVSPRLFLQQKWLSYATPGVASYNVTKFEFGSAQTATVGTAAVPKRAFFTESNYTGYGSRASMLGWQSPLTPLVFQSSGLGSTTINQLFPQAGTYGYGIELTVTKLASSSSESVVYIGNLDLELLGSSWGLLGTDGQGRDVFSQLVYGTRISLYVGMVASIIGVVIGLIVGLVSAYMGGIVDEVLMRFTDALLVLPGLPLMIVLITVVANGQYNLNIFIMVIGFLGWMGFARVVRSQVLSLKERPYVEAAKAVGAGTPYILFRHIMPNVVVLIYVTLALSVPGAIVAEAAFSFLGFIDPTQMSWGRMLNSTINRPEIWWVIIPPGLAIAVLSLSFILIGYAMDDILNPKLRTRR